MPVLPLEVEDEIRNHLTELCVNPKNYEVNETYSLDRQDITLEFSISYQEYVRKGVVKHGSEVCIRVEDADDLVETDIESINDHLGNIFTTIVEPYDGDFYLTDEGDEYVFIEEIIQDEP